MSDFERTMQLRAMAANIGSCYEKAALAWDAGQNEVAVKWDTLAGDIVYLLRNHARDVYKPGVLEAEYRSINQRWAELALAA